MATDPGETGEHEDPQTLEDAEEAGPDASHGPGHRAAEQVGPDDHGNAHEHDGEHEHDLVGAQGHGHAGHGASALGASGHDGPDADDHPAENPRWVLLPLAVGFLIGVIVLLIVGFNSGALTT